MKSSNKLTQALFLLAALIIFGVGFISPTAKSMAEGVASAVQAASYQADAGATRQQTCEDREVEADEGYGVTRREIRHICR